MAANRIQTWERDYVTWQNRAFRFYLGARLCYFNDLYAPAVFCGQQALESLLKGTLVYWDRSFSPEAAGHSFRKMFNIFKNKEDRELPTIPEYFYAQGRYQSTSRYPSGGFVVPATFLQDLDTAFYELVIAVPFQFNTELKRMLRSRDSANRRVLSRRNTIVRRLQRALDVRR